MWTERLPGALAAIAAVAAGVARGLEPPPTVQPGLLTVAVYQEFVPFADAGQGSPRGIDVEVGKALAAKLGLAAEVREYHEADSVDGDLRNIIWRGHHLWRGRLADVMMHVPTDPWVVKNNERVRIFGSYFRERLVVARSKSRIPNLPTLQVFTSERIGVQAEALEDRYLVTAFGGVLRRNVVHYRSVTDAVAGMLKDEVSAVMGRQTMIEAALAGRAGYEIAPAPAPGLALGGWELGLAVKAENPELAAALERAMAELVADGTIRGIFARHGVTWLAPEGAPAPPPPRGTELVPPAPPPAAAPPPAGAGTTGPGPQLGEDIVVTATRGTRARRDAPAAVTVVGRGDIEHSPTKTTDELLRAVPSFGLFRRSSSVAADPTSQGVNLRGIGPSGVSRSLVLADGVPVNDPFGGWVYWRALPRVGTERIEVVPGGGSALYGSYALGGVTQVVPSPIAPRAARGFAEVGSFENLQAGLWASDRLGPVGVAVEAEGLRSEGYTVVAPAQRGPIDGPTPSESVVVNGRFEADAAEGLRLRARTGYFYEDWNGGTQWTSAGVKRWDWAGGGRFTPGAAGTFDLSVFGQVATFTQSRGRVVDPATRTTETQSAWQDVPAHDLGASALWTSPPLQASGVHFLTAGVDGRRISGTTHEDLYPAVVTPASVTRRDAGGVQYLLGVFVQEVYDVGGALSLHAALRYDRWVDSDGSMTEQRASGTTTTAFGRRTDEQLSPKLGVVVRPAGWLTLRAGGYQAFRAPTLNELYRPFQVGQVLTQANATLGPEKLLGAEAGVDVTPVPPLALRVTGFWTALAEPITNVTIGTNLRQRQNLGEARVRGVEASASWRFARPWLASVAYTYADNEVTDAPGQPQLVGKDLPQDPRHRATASLAFDDPRIVTGAVQVRYVGAQYEDDLNTLRMDAFAVVDLSFARRLSERVDVVLAVENLLDEQYTVGLAGGLETIGQPRYVHGGVRFVLDR